MAQNKLLKLAYKRLLPNRYVFEGKPLLPVGSFEQGAAATAP
jgi:hypothetical protein